VPILIVYPAFTLILLVLAASFIGDGLRDALDPRQRIEK
jgi:peptide/nickel transport system permease protein